MASRNRTMRRVGLGDFALYANILRKAASGDEWAVAEMGIAMPDWRDFFHVPSEDDSNQIIDNVSITREISAKRHSGPGAKNLSRKYET